MNGRTNEDGPVFELNTDLLTPSVVEVLLAMLENAENQENTDALIASLGEQKDGVISNSELTDAEFATLAVILTSAEQSIGFLQEYHAGLDTPEGRKLVVEDCITRGVQGGLLWGGIGVLSGGGIGSLFPVVGTTIGAAAGGLIFGVTGAIAGCIQGISEERNQVLNPTGTGIITFVGGGSYPIGVGSWKTILNLMNDCEIRGTC